MLGSGIAPLNSGVPVRPVTIVSSQNSRMPHAVTVNPSQVLKNVIRPGKWTFYMHLSVDIQL